MKKIKFTEAELALLNSKIGLHTLLKNKKVNLNKILEDVKCSNELRKKQEELIKLQNWVIKNDKKVVILFEGRDAAGKGGAIRRITEYINATSITCQNQEKLYFSIEAGTIEQ